MVNNSYNLIRFDDYFMLIHILDCGYSSLVDYCFRDDYGMIQLFIDVYHPCLDLLELSDYLHVLSVRFGCV